MAKVYGKANRVFPIDQPCSNPFCKDRTTGKRHIMGVHDKNGCRKKHCDCTVANPTIKSGWSVTGLIEVEAKPRHVKS